MTLQIRSALCGRGPWAQEQKLWHRHCDFFPNCRRKPLQDTHDLFIYWWLVFKCVEEQRWTFTEPT